MSLRIILPDEASLELTDLLVDVNGTLTNRGVPIPGVPQRIAQLARIYTIHLVSADTFGTLDALAESLKVRPMRVQSGQQKLWYLDDLGRSSCAVVGNGANDGLALQAAALGIAVLGPEGTSPMAIGAADVICRTVLEALDLLSDPTALAATLRR